MRGRDFIILVSIIRNKHDIHFSTKRVELIVVAFYQLLSVVKYTEHISYRNRWLDKNRHSFKVESNIIFFFV